MSKTDDVKVSFILFDTVTQLC